MRNIVKSLAFLKWIQFLFIVIVAMVISASMRVVGILLVSALITLPIAISMRITKSFKQLILLSVFLGELSVILGLVLAFYMDISPGGVIVSSTSYFTYDYNGLSENANEV
ncbi:metal ABC transporter permease [Staphylococcus aureus]|nr:metal ABC transporter permease [Staphylococcus aureus]